MHPTSKRVTVSAIAAALALAAAGPAAAKCQKMGFLVNDYGKDGPTKDAQDLLDKDIVKWAAQQGITKYTVSKKDVKCELFLNFVVFDEHTCTAEATVCWNEPPGSPGQQAKKSTPTDATPADAKPAKPTAAAAAAPEAPKKATADEAKTAVPAVAAPKQVETGTVAPAPAAVSTQDVGSAEKAAAAAERAAAAAERAAQAAERAAQAAEDLASAGPVQKYAAPAAAVEAIPSVPPADKEKTVAPVPPR